MARVVPTYIKLSFLVLIIGVQMLIVVIISAFLIGSSFLVLAIVSALVVIVVISYLLLLSFHNKTPKRNDGVQDDGSVPIVDDEVVKEPHYVKPPKDPEQLPITWGKWR
ncbi:MAG: hypothetical protein M1481_01425 [Candidatus Thermoplasmatota archaeon]|nr:hypothetical protein [Candidatus Thermoplasmatota archaeon]